MGRGDHPELSNDGQSLSINKITFLCIEEMLIIYHCNDRLATCLFKYEQLVKSTRQFVSFIES